MHGWMRSTRDLLKEIQWRCCEINCILLNSSVDVWSPVPQHVTKFGDRLFKGLIKVFRVGPNARWLLSLRKRRLGPKHAHGRKTARRHSDKAMETHLRRHQILPIAWSHPSSLSNGGRYCIIRPVWGTLLGQPCKWMQKEKAEREHEWSVRVLRPQCKFDTRKREAKRKATWVERASSFCAVARTCQAGGELGAQAACWRSAPGGGTTWLYCCV